MHERFLIRITANSPAETMKARRQWDDIFKALENKTKPVEQNSIWQNNL